MTTPTPAEKALAELREAVIELQFALRNESECRSVYTRSATVGWRGRVTGRLDAFLKASENHRVLPAEDVEAVCSLVREREITAHSGIAIYANCKPSGFFDCCGAHTLGPHRPDCWLNNLKLAAARIGGG